MNIGMFLVWVVGSCFIIYMAEAAYDNQKEMKKQITELSYKYEAME